VIVHPWCPATVGQAFLVSQHQLAATPTLAHRHPAPLGRALIGFERAPPPTTYRAFYSPAASSKQQAQLLPPPRHPHEHHQPYGQSPDVVGGDVVGGDREAYESLKRKYEALLRHQAYEHARAQVEREVQAHVRRQVQRRLAAQAAAAAAQQHHPHRPRLPSGQAAGTMDWLGADAHALDFPSSPWAGGLDVDAGGQLSLGDVSLPALDDDAFGLDDLLSSGGGWDADAVSDSDDGGSDLFNFMGAEVMDAVQDAVAHGVGGPMLPAAAAAPTPAAVFPPAPAVLAPAAPRKRKAAERSDSPVVVVAEPVAAADTPSVKVSRGPDGAPSSVVASVGVGAGSSGGGGRGSAAPQRTVPWRKPGSALNARMRGAVWLYRFAPSVRSKTIQRAFGVSVKSLMRYVYDSCDPAFRAYDLYFGAAGQSVAGMADRALSREQGRMAPQAVGYTVDWAAADVPALARRFLTDTLTTAVGGGGGDAE
jgi:hypothetical protein